MKSNYEEKKQARIDRYKALSIKNGALSDSAYKAAKQIGDFIPFGQPILVGHHSEGRHRRDLDRIDNNMRKSVEADKKASYYEEKAESAESNDAISSDNPNAIELLKEKLANLERGHVAVKAAIKILKNKKLDQMKKIEAISELGFSGKTATSFVVEGIPSYRLSYNTANMRTVKQRIETLEKVAAIQHSEDVAPNSLVKLVINPQDNRVQIFFPSKPDYEMIKKLKGYGFHWSPTVGAWMRQISNAAIYYGKQIFHAAENLEVGKYAQHEIK